MSWVGQLCVISWPYSLIWASQALCHQTIHILKNTDSVIFFRGKGLIVVLLLLLCSERNTIMGAQWLCGRATRDQSVSGSSLTGGTALCPCARHINHCLVLVQTR